MKKQFIFAVSGVKNSGKTTLISSLIKIFKRKNLNLAVIKHDGHDFMPDVPDTDSYKFRNVGADGTAVVSDKRIMVVKEMAGISEREVIKAFPEADIIILEGFKYSEYLKVEIVRSENSDAPVCDPRHLLGIVTDIEQSELPAVYREIPVYSLDEVERLGAELLKIRMQTS